MTGLNGRSRTSFVRRGLQAWAKQHGCVLLSWRFVGVCVEARIEVERDVELRVLAPSLGEVLAKLMSELSGHRRGQLRVVRGGKQ